MSEVERPPLAPSDRGSEPRTELSAGALPLTLIVVLGLVVAIDLLRRNDQVPRYGEASELTVARSEGEEEYILVRVAPQMTDGQLTTPTWENLFRAYNLRDSDMTAALEEYNRGVGEGESYALPSSRIPAGTQILLPVR